MIVRYVDHFGKMQTEKLPNDPTEAYQHCYLLMFPYGEVWLYEGDNLKDVCSLGWRISG